MTKAQCGECGRAQGYPLYCMRCAEEMLKQSEQEQKPVQVSPLEFVEMVMKKEHLIGNPIFWAEWPNKEKNT